MVYRTDDPIRDFHYYDADQEDEYYKLPICNHCRKRMYDESKHGREKGYIGIANYNEDIFVSEEDAYAYAFERCVNGTDEEIADFKEMLVEWFYSGNWLPQEVCEEE